jgi:hypothetical protein
MQYPVYAPLPNVQTIITDETIPVQNSDISTNVTLVLQVINLMGPPRTKADVVKAVPDVLPEPAQFVRHPQLQTIYAIPTIAVIHAIARMDIIIPAAGEPVLLAAALR